MQLRKQGNPLTDEILKEFEDRYQLKMPEDYVELMKKNNGGYVEDNMEFNFVEAGSTELTESILRRFFSFSNENDGMSRIRSRVIDAGEAPPSLLLIADDVFGNPIFIGISDSNYGKVYFGNHELEDPSTGYLVMSQIADTFTEFIEKLHLAIYE
ncbi:MAG: SMI1/KNR4 family protein [Coriobacteriia bacterium]|nr:SMI1/KNR4 family protein [Coriobacteriia bacterium]